MASEELKYTKEIEEPTNGLYARRRSALLHLACSAIIVHHCQFKADKDANKRIRFNENPLGFVLVLSDEIHEVGRLATSHKAINESEPHTCINYADGEIDEVLIEYTGIPKLLNLQYRLRKGHDSSKGIRGKNTDKWTVNKQNTLIQTLHLNDTDDDLISKINVEVVDS